MTGLPSSADLDAHAAEQEIARMTASQPVAQPAVELPPIHPERHPSSEIYTSNIPEAQRAKWRRMWAQMDEDDCQRHHYKHYEWECRKTFEELEECERQLLAALAKVREFEDVDASQAAEMAALRQERDDDRAKWKYADQVVQRQHKLIEAAEAENTRLRDALDGIYQANITTGRIHKGTDIARAALFAPGAKRGG